MAAGKNSWRRRFAVLLTVGLFGCWWGLITPAMAAGGAPVAPSITVGPLATVRGGGAAVIVSLTISCPVQTRAPGDDIEVQAEQPSHGSDGVAWVSHITTTCNGTPHTIRVVLCSAYICTGGDGGEGFGGGSGTVLHTGNAQITVFWADPTQTYETYYPVVTRDLVNTNQLDRPTTPVFLIASTGQLVANGAAADITGKSTCVSGQAKPHSNPLAGATVYQAAKSTANAAYPITAGTFQPCGYESVRVYPDFVNAGAAPLHSGAAFVNTGSNWGQIQLRS